MISKVDLNSDLGEIIPSADSVNYDRQIMPYISSCNISCGAHAGNVHTVESAILSAIENNVAIGAHPSYPDKENFGRLTVKMNSQDFIESIIQQLDFLLSLCAKHNVTLHHIKAHGALYNDLQYDMILADQFIETIEKMIKRTKIVGLPHSPFGKNVLSSGHTYIREVFADRRYTSELKLMSRSQQGAVLSNREDVMDQIKLFMNESVADHSGKIHNIEFDSICVHGDNPEALSLVREISDYLKNNDIEIGPT